VEEAQDDSHRGGLARAVRAEESEDLAGADVERHAVQRLDVAKPLAQAVDS
jgi:hypothetical protein